MEIKECGLGTQKRNLASDGQVPTRRHGDTEKAAIKQVPSSILLFSVPPCLRASVLKSGGLFLLVRRRLRTSYLILGFSGVTGTPGLGESGGRFTFRTGGPGSCQGSGLRSGFGSPAGESGAGAPGSLSGAVGEVA